MNSLHPSQGACDKERFAVEHPARQLRAQRDAQKDPYLRCREMVVAKALDAHVVALNEENKRLRTALRSICALPDKRQTLRQACTVLSQPKS
jgi:hypothetical protein